MNFRRANTSLSSPFTKKETKKSPNSKDKEKSNKQLENGEKTATIAKKRQEINNAIQRCDPDNTSQSQSGKNLILRSRYCQEEMSNAEYSKTSSRSYPRPGRGSSAARGSADCDVTFLRTLLAMNKKQEIMLNKKLARILWEEECGGSSRSGPAHNHEDELHSVSSADTESNRKRAPFTKYQYDLNGRRIFTFTAGESENNSIAKADHDERKFRIQPNSMRAKTWIKTTTLVKTKSDTGLNGRDQITSKRKSLASPNLPTEHDNNPKEEYEDELQPMNSLWPKVEVESQECSFDCREPECHGDGIQNVVVHCCEVAQQQTCTDSKRRVVKVWRFNKANTGSDENRLTNIHSPFEKEKTKTHNANCQGRPLSNQRSRKLKLRSNTIC